MVSLAAFLCIRRGIRNWVQIAISWIASVSFYHFDNGLTAVPAYAGYSTPLFYSVGRGHRRMTALSDLLTIRNGTNG